MGCTNQNDSADGYTPTSRLSPAQDAHCRMTSSERIPGQPLKKGSGPMGGLMAHFLTTGVFGRGLTIGATEARKALYLQACCEPRKLARPPRLERGTLCLEDDQNAQFP